MEEQPPHTDTQALGKVMAICAWVLVILLMTLFFTHWSKENQKSKTYLATVNGLPRVMIQPNAHHQYLVEGQLNGQPVVFLLDTGASSVVIPGKIAKALNLHYGPQGIASTAGGKVIIYQTRVEEVVIGNITLHNVIAAINPAMDDEQVLLGMSALKKFSFYQDGDNLILMVKEGGAKK